jgi:hypothetical protein
MLLGHIIHRWHGFCNFSHAQQGQLLPMSGEQTVGVGGMRISVGRMVDPIDGPVCQTALGGDLTSYYSVEGAARPQPASFGESGIAALIGARLLPTEVLPRHFWWLWLGSTSSDLCFGSSRSLVAWRKYAFEKDTSGSSSRG